MKTFLSFCFLLLCVPFTFGQEANEFELELSALETKVDECSACKWDSKLPVPLLKEANSLLTRLGPDETINLARVKRLLGKLNHYSGSKIIGKSYLEQSLELFSSDLRSEFDSSLMALRDLLYLIAKEKDKNEYDRTISVFQTNVIDIFGEYSRENLKVEETRASYFYLFWNTRKEREQNLLRRAEIIAGTTPFDTKSMRNITDLYFCFASQGKEGEGTRPRFTKFTRYARQLLSPADLKSVGEVLEDPLDMSIKTKTPSDTTDTGRCKGSKRKRFCTGEDLRFERRFSKRGKIVLWSSSS